MQRKLSLMFFFFFALAALTACEPVKTKTTLDRVYELDPSGKTLVSPTLKEKPPRTVAVLPFRSQIGEGRIERSRSLFNFLTGREKDNPELVAEKMRRAFFGQFSQLEFDHVKLSRVDRILKSAELDSWEKIRSVSAQHLGELLGAEAFVFGQVTHFDYYYAFLYSQLAVGLSL